ncbi:MAG TPA: hypothetical protein VMC03_14080, partial [Streptosporangiaceae bacterium]|nr:hypothetical protein [Streptosporangiaceae bacterium]
MANDPAPSLAHEEPADCRLTGYAGAGITPMPLDPGVLAPGELGVAEIAALCWLDPEFEAGRPDPEHGNDGSLGSEHAPGLEPDEPDEFVVDLGDGPMERWERLPAALRRELLGDDRCGDGLDAGEAGEDGQDQFEDLIEAGFMHRYPVPGACGFRAGGPLDVMLPGSELAWFAGGARQRGLGELSDDELIGFLAAARRGEAWQFAMVVAATAELDARRAQPDGREGEHVADELAAALTLTGRAAQAQLELSRQLERLPHTAGLLAAGVIDRPRAVVIA